MNLDSLPPLPALVQGRVRHRRRTPIERSFEHPLHQWLVDVDALPSLPRWARPLAGFSSEDHLLRGTSIRGDVDRVLADHGIDRSAAARVVMLANARALGYVFDPLTVFWCFDAGGELTTVLAEVHNTYGQWHTYVLRSGDGVARTAKQLYVSPFFDVSGEYEMRCNVTQRSVDVAVTLRRDGDVAFEADMSGVPRLVTPARLARTLLRRPLAPQRVSALIRAHGITLWARGLPVVPRPTAPGRS